MYIIIKYYNNNYIIKVIIVKCYLVCYLPVVINYLLVIQLSV